MPTTCSKDPQRSYDGFEGYLDKWKDIPPTDIPHVTGKIVSVLPSHTPCATGDVANVLPIRTLDKTGDVVNNPQYHTSLPQCIINIDEELDIAGDVVNDPKDHTSLELDVTGDVVNAPTSHTVIADKNSWTKINKSELIQFRNDAAIGKAIRKNLPIINKQS